MVQQIASKPWPVFAGVAEGEEHPGLETPDWMRIREQIVADLGLFNDRFVCMREHSRAGEIAGASPYKCHHLSHPAPALSWLRQDAGMTPGPSATSQRLRLNIAERMRMSHIDQPLML